MHWFLRRVAFSFGLIGIVGALAVFAAQCLSWFELDSWPDLSILRVFVAFGWRPPTATSPGIGRAIEIVMGTPLSILILVVGLALRFIISLCAKRVAPKERDT
jgi:hypothetical protein